MGDMLGKKTDKDAKKDDKAAAKKPETKKADPKKGSDSDDVSINVWGSDKQDDIVLI